MADVHVRHQTGDRFSVEIRGHRLTVDQPTDMRGTDQGPTPTELFVAALAACVAFYAGRFFRRHDLPTEGFGVECDFQMSEDRPARVAEISIRVALPAGFPEARREALRRVVEHCTVHNSIRIDPTVTVDLVPAERVA